MLLRARRALLSVLGLSPEEFARVWPLGACYAATLAALYVLKPVRNALFLEVLGLHRLPWVLLSVAALGALAASFFARLSARLPIARALPFVLGSAAAAVVGFRFWLEGSGAAAVFAFYLIVNLFGQLATSLLWLWANESFDTRQARRVFGFIAGSGILGAFIGGVGTQYCVAWFGSLDLLWFAVVSWLLALGLSLRGRQVPNVRATPVRSGAGLSELWTSPLVRILSLGAMVGAASSALVDLQFNAVVDRAFSRADDKAAFFGAFFAWLNLGAFAFQLLLAPALLRRLGLGVSVLLLPVSLLGGALFTLIHPVVSAGVALKSADVGLRHSLSRSVTEVLFAPLPPPIRVRARVLLDTLFDNLGTGVGAGLGLLLVSRSEPGQFGIGVATVATVLVSSWLAVRLRPAYLDALKSGLLRRRVHPEALHQVALGASVRDLLIESLASDNPRQVDYAIDVLRGADVRGLGGALRPLLTHEQALIRKKALSFLVDQEEPYLVRDAQRLLSDAEQSVRAEALRVLLIRATNRARMLSEYLHGDDPARWQAALSCIAQAPTSDDVSVFEPELFERLAGTVAEEQLVRAVGKCLLEYGEPDRLSWLVARLGEGRTRGAATWALVELGPRAHAALERALGEQSPASAGVARVLARGNDRASRRLLFDELVRRAPAERGQLLQACVDRRRREGRAFPGVRVGRLVASEIAWCHELARVAAVLLGRCSRLLARALEERLQDARLRLLRTLALAYPVAELHGAELALRSTDASVRARALELLDETLRPEHRQSVLGVFETKPKVSADARAESVAMRWLAEQPDEWLRTVARCEQPSPEAPFAASVQGVLGVVEKVLLLQSVDAFASATSEQLSLVAAIATLRAHDRGEMLYREGDLADAMYVVVRGGVKLERAGEEIGVLGPAEAFGTWSLFEQEPRLTSATAALPSEVLRIDRVEFLDVLADHVELTRAILASVARRLRAVLGRTET